MSRTLTLDEACASGVPVTIHRRALGPDADGLDGVVLATGAWTLVAALTEWAHSDGYALIRTGDVTKVRRVRKANQRFIERAAGALGAWPLPGPTVEVDLSSTHALLRAVERSGHLLAVHAEDASPGQYFPGMVEELTEEGLGLWFVDTAGRWERAPKWFTLDEITRVEVGTRYLDTLERFGDRPAFSPVDGVDVVDRADPVDRFATY